MSYEAAVCVQRLKALGQKRGFLTCEEINQHLPPSMVDPEEIVTIVEQLERPGIRIVENSPAEGP